MTVEPEALVPAFVKAGADYVTFHLEATTHAHRLAQSIHTSGAKVGVAIVPSTPASLLSELLSIVDLVLVMTVDPGFGGQSLISSCLDKCRVLASERKMRGLGYFISVDGGVNDQTLPEIARSGADVLVMGSAFFAAADPVKVVRDTRAAFKTQLR